MAANGSDEQYYSQTQSPPWIEAMYKQMAQQAEGLAAEKYKSYPSNVNRFPRFSPDTLRSHELAREAEGEWRPDLWDARGYLEQGTQRFPEHYQEYMNPYQDAVVNKLAELSKRSLKEQYLPLLESQFAGAGQHGSTRHQEMMARVMRDAQEALQAEQNKALMAGYENAGRLFNVEQSRNLSAAPEARNIGTDVNANNAADISKLSGAGAEQYNQQQKLYDQAEKEFEAQRQHPWNQLARQTEVVKGYPQSQSTVGGKTTAGAPEMSKLGQLGQLAGNIWATNRASEERNRPNYGYKAGGSLEKMATKRTMNIPRLKPLPKPKKQGAAKAPGNPKKLGTSKLTTSNMAKAPKLGGKFGFMHKGDK